MNYAARRVVVGLVAGLTATVTLVGCGGAADRPTTYPDGSIAAILAADDRFDTLMGIIEQDAPEVVLASLASPDLDITWFAPTDEAFAALLPETFDTLRDDGNVSDLQTVLDHHAIATAYSMDELRSEAQSGNGEVEPIGGGPISLALADGVLHAGEATVTEADIEASNGVIHVIDAVLIPDSVSIP